MTYTLPTRHGRSQLYQQNPSGLQEREEETEMELKTETDGETEMMRASVAGTDLVIVRAVA